MASDKTPLARAHEAIDRLYGEITSPVNHRAMRLVTEAHAALEEAVRDAKPKPRRRYARPHFHFEDDDDD